MTGNDGCSVQQLSDGYENIVCWRALAHTPGWLYYQVAQDGVSAGDVISCIAVQATRKDMLSMWIAECGDR